MLVQDEIKKNRKEILELLHSVKREGMDGLIDWYEKAGFFRAPASSMHHGNFEGGLAAHSYKIFQEFEKRLQSYSFGVPRESRIVAAFGHDACKISDYHPNILKNGEVSDKKPYKVVDSFPLGHGEKSVFLLQRYIDLSEKEAMLIRWHMGPYDPAWEDYKEKICKYFPEAVLFHHVDMEVPLIYGL